MCEITQRLNEQWWSEICRGSFRDQLSFPYTLGKVSKYIETEWERPFNSRYTKWYPHKTKKKVLEHNEMENIIKNFYKN